MIGGQTKSEDGVSVVVVHASVVVSVVLPLLVLLVGSVGSSVVVLVLACKKKIGPGQLVVKLNKFTASTAARAMQTAIDDGKVKPFQVKFNLSFIPDRMTKVSFMLKLSMLFVSTVLKSEMYWRMMISLRSSRRFYTENRTVADDTLRIGLSFSMSMAL